MCEACFKNYEENAAYTCVTKTRFNTRVRAINKLYIQTCGDFFV